MQERYLTSLFWIPPLVVLGIFELFLGHRHDYSGHYLAGYGATFIAAMLGVRIAIGQPAERLLPYLVVPFCLLCICGGIITEATIFRLAKFDEVDFFNQSLGAVLAMMIVQHFLTLLLDKTGSENELPDNADSTLEKQNLTSKPPKDCKVTNASVRWCDGGIIIGVIYLGIGGVLAFA
jgi:hypothetical protein